MSLGWIKASAVAGAVMLSVAGTSHGAVVTHSLMSFGGNTWEVEFTVTADPGQTVEAFSVYFDWAMVSNIQVLGSPADWDSLALQADSSPSDGLFDTLALVAGIGPGQTLGGFSARFDWASAGGPTSFRFSINDPVTFASLETARTTAAGGPSVNPVPEPSTWVLSLAALGLLAARRTLR
jgi:hypothetical protein